MKLLLLLPELEEGGVERHVVALASTLSARGHDVCVVSRGGKLEKTLAATTVTHWRLPVHSKNPVTILACAWRVAAMARREGFQIIHAHSRVPAWVGYLASVQSKIPLVVSAHFLSGNRSFWIYHPYRRAARVICVSRSVEQAMADCFGGNTVVIYNGLPSPPVCRQQGSPADIRREAPCQLLFIGRLVQSKGLQDVLRALAALKTTIPWRLDVLGDGPLRPELKSLAQAIGISDRVLFHGFCDDPDEWLKNCSCLLFPSYHEGMSLTLARAIQLATPIIASDIAAVREFCQAPEFLIPPGDLKKWQAALQQFLASGQASPGFDPQSIPTVAEMTSATEAVYHQVLKTNPSGGA